MPEFEYKFDEHTTYMPHYHFNQAGRILETLIVEVVRDDA
jgi:hypothetical protein